MKPSERLQHLIAQREHDPDLPTAEPIEWLAYATAIILDELHERINKLEK